MTTPAFQMMLGSATQPFRPSFTDSSAGLACKASGGLPKR